MRPSLLRLAQHRTPLIKFLGKRSLPGNVDHTPHVHPASPVASLPDSFAESFVNYRSKVQQHGPLIGSTVQSSPSITSTSSTQGEGGGAPGPKPTKGPSTYGLIGGRPGRDLGPVEPQQGEFFDRSELPRRFRALEWEQKEIDAVESGGASLWN